MYSAPTSGLMHTPSHSIDNLTGGWMAFQESPNTATAWGTQYRAIYVPIRVVDRCVVRKLGFASAAAAAGNVDVGLYDANGARLVSSGPTTKTGTGVQVVDVADTTIGPGLYYIGLNNDTTTDTVTALAGTAPVPAARGVLTETLGGVALPASASWAVDNVLSFIPIVTALLVTEVS